MTRDLAAKKTYLGFAWVTLIQMDLYGIQDLIFILPLRSTSLSTEAFSSPK